MERLGLLNAYFLTTHAGGNGMRKETRSAGQITMQHNNNPVQNTEVQDNSSKVIFDDPILCSQLLRDYTDIPLLKNVRPEDIEDVTERYVPLFLEERNSDVVKRVNLKRESESGETEPLFLVSLIEHKSRVDYNVVMQILRYMVYIWEDYEKEMERLHNGITRTKGFRYPPILPIIYYEGAANWTAAIQFHDRVFLSDVLSEYIPNFSCKLIALRDFSNEYLMGKEGELSLIMLINKLQDAADFAKLSDSVSKEYLTNLTESTPEYLLDMIAKVIEILLRKMNVPYDEAEAFSMQIKERRMGELFENFKGYDVQAVRKEEREKTTREVTREVTEAAIQKMIAVLQEVGCTQETIMQKLEEKYGLTSEEAENEVMRTGKGAGRGFVQTGENHDESGNIGNCDEAVCHRCEL